MSKFYKGKRTRNIYDPISSTPFRLSRSRLERFIECPRCFYLDRRLGVDRPPGYPFTLNSAVDALLKKEFDIYRQRGEPHPLITKYNVDAKPIPHKDLETWRENFKGIQFLDQSTNLIITGAIDDLWQNNQGEYIVVDYKSTSKAEAIEALDQDWHISYKRQMEIYQWLLHKNGYNVSNTGYFVYCNGDTAKETFDAKLEFNLTLIAYTGDFSWVEQTIKDAHKCLCSANIPIAAPECDYCRYIEAVLAVAGNASTSSE